MTRLADRAVKIKGAGISALANASPAEEDVSIGLCIHSARTNMLM
jgi:hypothetical protein